MGRYLDWDGWYGPQCLDLMRFYQRDVLNVPTSSIPPAGYAKDVFNNFRSNTYFAKVLNGPNNVPVKGDIVFWGTYPFVTGIAGHVAIFEKGDIYTFVTYDQNYPTGTPCHSQQHGTNKILHGYRGVLGWLHPLK